MRAFVRLLLRAPLVLLSAVLLAGPLPGVPPVHGDELADLRGANEALQAEVESLRLRLAAVLEGCAPRPPGHAADAPDAASELVFVPRSRVSLAVERDAATGDATIATQWHRTVVAGTLPRREWLQLRAQQRRGGETAGTWLVLERHGGGGRVDVPSGRIEADRRVIELPVEAYDASRDDAASVSRRSTVRRERVRFALPPGALGTVGSARQARFVAGSSTFDLTDEHVTAFAALAARLDAPAPPAATPAR